MFWTDIRSPRAGSKPIAALASSSICFISSG